MYYIRAFKNYFKYDGRASRREFWMFFIPNIIVVTALSFVDGYMGWYLVPEVCGYLGFAYCLIGISPSVCIQIRRLHDVGKSGYWWWANVVPILNLYLLFLFLKKGDANENRFGAPSEFRGEHRKDFNETTTKKVRAETVPETRSVSAASVQPEFVSENVKFCWMCGEPLLGDSKFCHRCGTAVAEVKAKTKNEAFVEGKVSVKERRSSVDEVVEKNQQSRKNFVGITIGFLIAAVVCCGVGGVMLYGVPYLRNNSAVQDMAAGDEDAEENLQGLDDENMIMEASYLRAMSMFDEGDYLAAKELFETHKDYKDSEAMIRKCDVERGREYVKDKKYDEAIKALLGLREPEAAPLLAECYYNRMLVMVAEEDWDKAYTNCKDGLKFDHQEEFDFKKYQYQIYTEYVQLRLQKGTEWSYSAAEEAIDSLIEVWGETDELKELEQGQSTWRRCSTLKKKIM